MTHLPRDKDISYPTHQATRINNKTIHWVDRVGKCNDSLDSFPSELDGKILPSHSEPKHLNKENLDKNLRMNMKIRIKSIKRA